VRTALEVLLLIFAGGAASAFMWLVLWGAVQDGREQRRYDRRLQHRR
jgi:hypothetical protein